MITSPIALDPSNQLTPLAASDLGSLVPISQITAEVQRYGTFASVLNSAKSISTEYGAYTNSRVQPPYLGVPSYVVILGNVPLSSFAHGGSPNAPLAGPVGVNYDYYIVVNADTGSLIASFDEPHS
jgi:hypothetical protein